MWPGLSGKSDNAERPQQPRNIHGGKLFQEPERDPESVLNPAVLPVNGKQLRLLSDIGGIRHAKAGKVVTKKCAHRLKLAFRVAHHAPSCFDVATGVG
jgi:hypothetical protein